MLTQKHCHLRDEQRRRLLLWIFQFVPTNMAKNPIAIRMWRPAWQNHRCAFGTQRTLDIHAVANADLVGSSYYRVYRHIYTDQLLRACSSRIKCHIHKRATQTPTHTRICVDIQLASSKSYVKNQKKSFSWNTNANASCVCECGNRKWRESAPVCDCRFHSLEWSNAVADKILYASESRAACEKEKSTVSSTLFPLCGGAAFVFVRVSAESEWVCLYKIADSCSSAYLWVLWVLYKVDDKWYKATTTSRRKCECAIRRWVRLWEKALATRNTIFPGLTVPALSLLRALVLRR